MASPVPKIQRPTIRINRVLAGGLVDMGSVALHHVVGTSLAGRRKESTPIDHDGTSALNPIGESGCTGCLPCHYLWSLIRVIGNYYLDELVLCVGTGLDLQSPFFRALGRFFPRVHGGDAFPLNTCSESLLNQFGGPRTNHRIYPFPWESSLHHPYNMAHSTSKR